MASQLSAVSCSRRRSGKFIPAATTRTSMPSDSPTSSTTRQTASLSEMSSACAWTSLPPEPSSMASWRRAAACTLAPASAKRFATESPIPLLAPMTSAVFPESVPSCTALLPPRREEDFDPLRGTLDELREGVRPLLERQDRRQVPDPCPSLDEPLDGLRVVLRREGVGAEQV